jgi:hypothetical protein
MTSPLDMVASGCSELHQWLDAVEELLEYLAANHLSPDSDAIPATMVANAGDGDPLHDLNDRFVYWIDLLQQQAALAERHPQIQRMIALALERIVGLNDRWIWVLLEHGLVGSEG